MTVTMKTKTDMSVFTFKDTHNTVVNAIRRVILDEVPTLAIEDVEISVNDSPLYDETIAHRLGLIPLKTDYKAYGFKESCKCGGIGCALCEVKMSIQASKAGEVLSGSIKSDDPKVVPADKEIPVTKLIDGKKLELTAKAIMGRGREHAKWAPAHTYLLENGKSVDLVIESFGQLSDKEIYNKAIEILCDKIDELGGQL